MSRITGSEVYGLMEAYNAVYSPQINEDYIWESCLTEEFISEAYQTVVDYLVYNGFVPGYNTAEVYMSEMAVEDIDSILFETNVLNEQYLIETGFFQGLGAGADKFVSGARTNIANKVKEVQGAAGEVQKRVTPVAQAVQGTAQRAVDAARTNIGNRVKAGQAVVGAAQRAVDAAKTDIGNRVKAGQAVVGGVVNSANRRIGQEIEISRKVGAGEPLGGSPSPTAKSTPSKFAGARDKAFSAAQGIKGSPVVGPKPSTPAPGARPATASPSMAKPATPAAKPATPAATTGNPPLKPPALPPITGKPSLRSGIDDLKKMGTASRQRQGLTQSFDVFDAIKGHLIDEGYADTEESATAIMANMSEEWRQSILDEGFKEIDREKHGRMIKRYKNLTRAAMRDAQETGEASGDNRFKMGKMSRVIDKSAENLRNRG